ncbi:hypothetical protein B0H13DRAFT_1856045 [Mycena leptocephala]|nr:hypothetical protein B0H13DRAFT_1856045 [Mycena leptocephala]
MWYTYSHAAPTKAANNRGAARDHTGTTQNCHRTVGHVSNPSLWWNSVLFFAAALTAAAARQSKPAQKLIPRPKGQAGKGSGYNLQKEMRLGQKKSRYNRLMHVVRYNTNRFLNTNKTIKDQDKSRLEKTIKKLISSGEIQKDFKYFQRFSGGWPIRAFIKQHLANTHDKYKRAVRHERAAEEDDTDDWSAVAQGNGEEVDDVGSDGGASDIEMDTVDAEDEHQDSFDDGAGDTDGAGAVDLELEDFQEDFEGNKKGDRENIPPTSPKTDKKPRPVPKPKAKSVGVTPLSPKKRKNLDSKPEESLRPQKQLKTDSPQPSPPPKIKVFSLKDVPRECPDTYCKDLVPVPLTSHLLSLFERKYKLVQQEGPKALGCRQLTKQICSAIDKELEPARYRTMAEEQGWPAIIDFDHLPARITAMFPDLRDILSISNVLAKSEIWKGFLRQIDYKVFAFCRSSASFEGAFLGTGYFGPKGQDVIMNTVQDLLKRRYPDVENDLYEATAPLVDTPQNWDDFDDSSNLLSVKKFTKHILVPHIATTLISEDLECTFAHAVNTLEDSRRCGEILYPNELEEKVDVIVTPKNEEPSEPPRYRKKVTLKVSEPRKITLDDYTPPVVQTKKAPKAKDKPKSKKDPKEPKPSRKQEEPRKHRTRSTKPDEWSIISFLPLKKLYSGLST